MGSGAKTSGALLAAWLVLMAPGLAVAQAPVAATSELRDLVDHYSEDRAALLRRYDAEYSPVRRARLRSFHSDWQDRLGELDFEALGVEGRIDFLLLEAELRYRLELLAREEEIFEEMAPLLPFAGTIFGLHEARRDRIPVDAHSAADTLDALCARIADARRTIPELGTPGDEPLAPEVQRASRTVAWRAAAAVDGLRGDLGRWYRYHDGYDPLFSWWASAPYERADSLLEAYASFLRRDIVGVEEGETEPIIGDPIGAEGLAAHLRHEMIPYEPDELLAVAEAEFEWVETEMRRAAADMGFGEDWRGALERVKSLHVEPGDQPRVVRDLAYEAERFVAERDLVTVPPLASEIWRMEMMSPERQLVNPFFTGGEVISVSFPTDAMEHGDKLMSMRGNNVPFSRATVHHELIPGHHLQGFMTDRFNTHRRAFRTPFWIEGWPLHWEMLLWDLGFPRTPEERVGMLFWRAHRAARIIFSLSFHLGSMTPREAVDFLVDRVGHERQNAVAEVRRSFAGSYPPLYQAAYMLGGLQIRSLHQELVGSGRMTQREFHDAILRGGPMPIEMLRARLLGLKLPRGYQASWRFAG